MTNKEKYQKFVKENLEGSSDLKLTELSMLEEMQREVRDIVEVLYESKSPKTQKMGSIMNAIFTQQAHVFLMSFRILNDLLKSDSNTKTKSCHSTDYNIIMSRLEASNVMQNLRKQAGKRAGMYELIGEHEIAVFDKLISKEMRDAMKAVKLELYDKTVAKEQPKEHKDILPKEEWNKLKEPVKKEDMWANTTTK